MTDQGREPPLFAPARTAPRDDIVATVRRLLLLVSAVVLVDMTFYAAIAPLLPEYQEDLGLSKSGAGALTASYAAGTLLGSLPAGVLAGRIGGRATTLVGLGMLVVSSVVFGFGEDIVVLDGARFLQGVGGACTWAGGFAWLMAVAPRERRGELIGTALGAAVVGILLGPVLGGAATETSPELVFSGIGVAALALTVVAFLTPAGPAPAGVVLGGAQGRPPKQGAPALGMARDPARAVLGDDRRPGAAAPGRARGERRGDRRGVPGGRRDRGGAQPAARALLGPPGAPAAATGGTGSERP